MTPDALTTAGRTAPDPFAGLRLTAADRNALARQGAVVAEYRSRQGRRWGPYFKLRWRHDGRQQVRYLGRDPALAKSIRAKEVVMQVVAGLSPRQVVRAKLFSVSRLHLLQVEGGREELEELR